MPALALAHAKAGDFVEAGFWFKTAPKPYVSGVRPEHSPRPREHARPMVVAGRAREVNAAFQPLRLRGAIVCKTYANRWLAI